MNSPVFFEKQDWIQVPEDWSKSIVQGKCYSTAEETGKRIWTQVELLLERYLYQGTDVTEQIASFNDPEVRYKTSILSKIRVGQGAFRVLITDAYQRQCSITGEKTLPVLESAHIQSYSKDGPHAVSNGLLLRSDMHKLFDNLYITITKDLKIEVSNRIKEEFLNGKEYYQYHGSSLKNIPTKIHDRPDSQYIEWHNSNIFKS